MKSNSYKALYKLRNHRMIGAIAFILLGFFAFSGCYGPFPLTLVVYEANGSVPTGVLRSLVFWLLNIIPVYGVALTLDIVVLNLIEFWIPGQQFDNPILDDVSGRRVSMVTDENGTRATLTVTENEHILMELRFIKISDTLCEIRDTSGNMLGSAKITPAGDLELMNDTGKIVQTVASFEDLYRKTSIE